MPSGKNTRRLTQSGGGAHELPPWLRPTYVLDESDPNIFMLRRADGSFVAAFSVRGATREGIRRVAEEDWRQRNRLESEHRASHVSQLGAEDRQPRRGRNAWRRSGEHSKGAKAASSPRLWVRR